MKARRCLGVVALLAIAACTQNVAFAPPRAQGQRAWSGSKIAHVVVIVQENRTTDNLFNGLPGADTVRTGLNSAGKRVRLAPIGLTAPYDLGHTHDAFATEYNQGKMDGFDRVPSECRGVAVCLPPHRRAYGFVPRAQVEPYFIMARRYAFADAMFQTNQGPSFPAHQYIVSGTSAIADGAKLRAAENPFHPNGTSSGGCDSPSGSLVALIDSAGDENERVFPCFRRTSLMQLLDKNSLTWRYYQAAPGPGLWNGPDAVLPIFKSRSYNNHVVAPPAQVLTDIAAGELADVVWVTPTALASDHALETDGSGPSWVAAVVNAIGQSRYWNDTAIFVTWDDWGGWYDHVSPHLYNSYELGFRVPLIAISPYVKAHYVSHARHEFGSILNFIEETFGLPSLHTTDARADDLMDCFDFSQPPRKFKPIRAKYPARYFIGRPSIEPDDSQSVPDARGYRVLYNFGGFGRSRDGIAPMSGLRDGGDSLYGTTAYGGTANANCRLGCGTLFALDASGNERVIYRFKGGSDGASPLAGVTLDGKLYGTTSAGGGARGCSGGCGTVYSASANGESESVLHAFAGGSDGADPVAPMVRRGGVFYGTTQYGGRIRRLCPRGCGTVFRIDSSGDERVIYRFNGGKDGANPVAPLYAGSNGLYGTTQYGGPATRFCATGCGTVFKINVAGVKKILHSFAYSPASKDGAYPAAGLAALGGKLYGTTIGGGRYADGTAFEIDPSSGDERVVHAFACCGTVTDGRFPVAGLIVVNGILFGTTRDGGGAGKGTVFKVRRSGAETVLHDFGGKPDGATPSGDLVWFGSRLYGTTANGGSRSEGAVFALTP